MTVTFAAFLGVCAAGGRGLLAGAAGGAVAVGFGALLGGSPLAALLIVLGGAALGGWVAWPAKTKGSPSAAEHKPVNRLRWLTRKERLQWN
jgi:hypothetical protein